MRSQSEQAAASELYSEGAALLEHAGSAYPDIEAEVLLAHVLGCGRLEMRMHSEQKPPQEKAEEYRAIIERRMKGEPVAYITGEQEFMSLAFTVGPGVLIPRRETEILVEKVLERFSGIPRLEGLDVGTGCGCIPLSIIIHLGGDVHFTAVDISREALRTAAGNAERHGCARRVEFMLSDIFSSLPGTLSYDCITANLPYVTEEEFTRTAPEVRNYEPASAITAGRDGLDLIRRFVTGAWSFLKPGGSCFLEIGYTQAAQVSGLFEADGHYGDIEVFRDYSGNERVVAAVRNRTGG